MMKLSILKYVCLFLVLFYHPFVVTAILKNCYKNYSFPALWVFGDSILDTGINSYIPTVVRANFKPYGRDFIGGKPTGRFCNGRLPSDFFVDALGIKESLPPYLDPNLTTEDLLTGVCFASAGSGYDPFTVELASALSPEDQLDMFKEYIGKLKAAVGEKRTSFILEKGLTIISMGSNDISGTYYLSPYRKHVYDIDSFTSMMVSSSNKFVQDLYNLGARRIGVFSLSPVGCVPVQRTAKGGINRECVDQVNQAAMLFNKKLSPAVTALGKKLPNSRIIYLENYIELNDIIQNHTLYGFDDGGSTCCGIANVELGLLCSSFTLKVCKDASKYVFWDGYHPTERVYQILVSEILAKNIDKFV